MLCHSMLWQLQSSYSPHQPWKPPNQPCLQPKLKPSKAPIPLHLQLPSLSPLLTPSSSLAAAVAAGGGPPATPTTKPMANATPSTSGPPPQAPTQSTTDKPKAKRSSKPSKSQSAGQLAATPKPPAASVPDPKLKDPVSQINKHYYDLVFTIKARGNLEAMAIQHLYLTKFLAAICQVDESAVLLPFRSYFALNKEVLYKPDRLDNPAWP